MGDLMKFAAGDLVRNVRTSEEGEVIEAYEENGVAESLQTPFKNNEPPSPGGRIHGRNPARRSTHWQGNEALFRSVDPLIGDSSIEALSRLAFRVYRVWRAG